MSKQIGFVKLKGKMGDVSFYSRKGVHSAKLGGGVSKERILTDPKFERTRENLSEFGGVATAVKSFRKAINKVSNFKDGSLGSRLTKVFRMIMKRADAIRGQRPVLLSQNKSLLVGFELTSGVDLFGVFSVPFTTLRDAAGKVATSMNLQSDMIESPANATHFRIVQMLGAIADTTYDEATKKFSPASDKDGVSEVTYSAYTPTRFANVTALNIETAINAALDANTSVIHGLGIVFYEKVGSEYYSLSQNSAMKIVNVFPGAAGPGPA